MRILKKKGTIKVVISILLGLVVMFFLIYWLFFSSTAYGKNVNKDCVADLKGRCSTLYLQCLPGERVSLIPAFCDKEGRQTCCVQERETTPDELCEGKGSSEQCGVANEYKVCDDSLQCIPKCEYCNDKPNDKICQNVTNDRGKKIDFTIGFGCSCTLSQCDAKQNDGKCVKKFCPGSSYCCAK